MSKLSDSLANLGTPGVGRLRGAGSRMGYQAATVNPAPQRSSLAKTFDDFGKAATKVLAGWDQAEQDKADERSNEIIRKLTPEQRREAIKNGSLLYQDDPYAMEALRTKSGRNAAYLVDDDVMTRVKNGEFRTREDMEAYRHEQLQKGAQTYADMYGINPDDEQYQKGFNSDITERNMSLYGAHDQFINNQTQSGAVMNTKVELNGSLSDPNFLMAPASGEFFEAYMNNGLKSGSIPNDTQASQIISGTLKDVMQRPGGAYFLQHIADRKITLNGATTTYRELMGDEQWNSFMVQAQKSQFENDAKINEKFELDIGSALNATSATDGWEKLQGIKAELDLRQPGEEMTPQRQRLIDAQNAMKAQMAREAQATAKAMDDQQKTINKNGVIDAQFQKRMNGDYVPTDFGNMPTNENTGEFKYSDMVNFANGRLAQIENMDITPEQKDALKLKYLRADSAEGPFRKAMGTLVTDAQQEWQASVINGEFDENSVALNNLRRIRNTDPNLFASLYPDQAELFLTMDLMDKSGIKPQILIDSARAQKAITKEMRFEDDKAWAALKNNSTSPELKYMPAQLDGMARKVYDAVKYGTGNPDMAMQQVDKYLKDNTFTFSSDDVDGQTYGVIRKNSLQVNDDPKSWEQGRDILKAARDGIIAKNPWMTNQQLTMYESGGSIYLMDTTGENRVRYDKELLSKVWKDQNDKAQEAATKKALEDAAKRAPITQATKARKAAGERVRSKKKTVPKFIYGGGE